MNQTNKSILDINSASSTSSVWGEPGSVLVKRILENIKQGDKVIDAPGGDGRYTELLCEAVGENGKVVHVDIDQKELEKLKNRFTKKYTKQLSMVQVDLTEPMPFGDNSIDGFLSAGFLHLPDLHKIRDVFFPEVKRILKPNGFFVGSFSVNVVRTNLDSGKTIPTLEFAKQDYSEEEGLALFRESFRDYSTKFEICKGLNFDFVNNDPPYNFSGTGIIFEILKK